VSLCILNSYMNLRMCLPCITLKKKNMKQFSVIYKVTASIRQYLETNTRMGDPGNRLNMPVN